MNISDIDVLISFGSNLEKSDAEDNIIMCQQALKLFQGTEVRFSSIYETMGEGSGLGKTYFNSIAITNKTKSSSDYISFFKRLEQHLGRDEEAKITGIVPIDIDLIIYDNKILREKDLQMNYLNKGLEELKIKR